MFFSHRDCECYIGECVNNGVIYYSANVSIEAQGIQFDCWSKAKFQSRESAETECKRMSELMFSKFWTNHKPPEGAWETIGNG